MLKEGGRSIPKRFQYEYFIETLAEEHGQSKRTIEREYTVKDYYLLLIKKSIEMPDK